MSLTLARLQQLKRQAGATAAAPARVVGAPARPVGSPSLDELRGLLRLRGGAPASAPSRDRELPGREIAPGLHLCEETLPDAGVPDAFDGGFDRGAPVPSRDLLFFDTETTGLAGGTGTRAFMVGAADWRDGRLRVRQLTIASTAAEAAMLDALAGWIGPRTILCSYNGKSYDAPLLATRYRLARRKHPLAGLRHIDLLHPTRRRYRGAFENCRLATIERRVLRVVREDDLPGAQAPAAWLGYLRGGGAGLLRRVQAHNRQDVISLALLLRHLAGDVAPGAG